MTENEIATIVVDCCYRIHKTFLAQSRKGAKKIIQSVLFTPLQLE